MNLPGFDTENTKRFLNRDAVPTIYEHVSSEALNSGEPSCREKRMASATIFIYFIFHFIIRLH